MNGIVKLYHPDRGYGLIQPLIGKPLTTPDVFFHITACVDGAAPPKGSEVSFTLVRGNQGPQAANVQVLKLKSRALIQQGGENDG